MPRDERKHQKALMKKRSKQKIAAQQRSHQQTFASLSVPAIIRRSRTFPILDCMISNNWDIDYAAQFGFEPDKDFALSQHILAPRGELAEPYHLTFGKDSKPFFIAGPYDNAERILNQLERTAGSGNYHFLAGFGDI